jgi:two-component system, OmpR family, sensor kinase
VKLSSRLSLATASITILVSLSIGAASIVTAERSEISKLDSIMETLLSQILNSENPLGDAFYYSQEFSIPLAVALLPDGGELTLLTEPVGTFEKMPTPVDLEQARVRGIEISGETPYRIRTFQLPDREYIIIATSLGDVQATRSKNVQSLLGFILISVIFGVLLILFFIRRDVSKIEVLVDTATKISEGDSLVKIQSSSGDSEVDRLTVALNKMVTSLQHALDIEKESASRMQEFLGDASHELRTPLTVIKGYVELLSKAQLVDPEQSARAYSRLTSEIERMEILIRDLLLLAELGQKTPEFSEEVNLSELVLMQINDLKVLDPNRMIESLIDGEIYLDGSRLHLQQMLANAFGNIRRHTPPDTPVHISLHLIDGKIHLEIGDGGPGLPTRAYVEGRQHFQRFDKSRSRETGGSGLGMSIMSGIINEHGGTIELGVSKLGGLLLEITLPA